MPEVMHTDPFHACSLGRFIQDPPQGAFLKVEDPVMLVNFIQSVNVVENFIIKKIGH